MSNEGRKKRVRSDPSAWRRWQRSEAAALPASGFVAVAYAVAAGLVWLVVGGSGGIGGYRLAGLGLIALAGVCYWQGQIDTPTAPDFWKWTGRVAFAVAAVTISLDGLGIVLLPFVATALAASDGLIERRTHQANTSSGV